MYLQHVLNDGKAKSIIESLSRSGEHYTEDVESLKSRYNKQCLTVSDCLIYVGMILWSESELHFEAFFA